MKKIITRDTKPNLVNYNQREGMASIRRKSFEKLNNDPEAFTRRRMELAGRNFELESLEEKLGIDGVKPSSRGRFGTTAITGTTSYSAFKGPDIVADTNSETGYRQTR